MAELTDKLQGQKSRITPQISIGQPYLNIRRPAESSNARGLEKLGSSLGVAFKAATEVVSGVGQGVLEDVLEEYRAGASKQELIAAHPVFRAMVRRTVSEEQGSEHFHKISPHLIAQSVKLGELYPNQPDMWAEGMNEYIDQFMGIVDVPPGHLAEDSQELFEVAPGMTEEDVKNVRRGLRPHIERLLPDLIKNSATASKKATEAALENRILESTGADVAEAMDEYRVLTDEEKLVDGPGSPSNKIASKLVKKITNSSLWNQKIGADSGLSSTPLERSSAITKGLISVIDEAQRLGGEQLNNTILVVTDALSIIRDQQAAADENDDSLWEPVDTEDRDGPRVLRNLLLAGSDIDQIEEAMSKAEDDYTKRLHDQLQYNITNRRENEVQLKIAHANAVASGDPAAILKAEADLNAIGEHDMSSRAPIDAFDFQNTLRNLRNGLTDEGEPLTGKDSINELYDSHFSHNNGSPEQLKDFWEAANTLNTKQRAITDSPIVNAMYGDVQNLQWIGMGHSPEKRANAPTGSMRDLTVGADTGHVENLDEFKKDGGSVRISTQDIATSRAVASLVLNRVAERIIAEGVVGDLSKHPAIVNEVYTSFETKVNALSPKEIRGLAGTMIKGGWWGGTPAPSEPGVDAHGILTGGDFQGTTPAEADMIQRIVEKWNLSDPGPNQEIPIADWIKARPRAARIIEIIQERAEAAAAFAGHPNATVVTAPGTDGTPEVIGTREEHAASGIQAARDALDPDGRITAGDPSIPPSVGMVIDNSISIDIFGVSISDSFKESSFYTGVASAVERGASLEAQRDSSTRIISSGQISDSNLRNEIRKLQYLTSLQYEISEENLKSTLGEVGGAIGKTQDYIVDRMRERVKKGASRAPTVDSAGVKDLMNSIRASIRGPNPQAETTLHGLIRGFTYYFDLRNRLGISEKVWIDSNSPLPEVRRAAIAQINKAKASYSDLDPRSYRKVPGITAGGGQNYLPSSAYEYMLDFPAEHMDEVTRNYYKMLRNQQEHANRNIDNSTFEAFADDAADTLLEVRGE